MIVSFIIVAYNSEKFLDKSLECLLKQNYNHKNIEVILVDSVSSDKTKQIMLDFKKNNKNEFKRIEVLDNLKRTLPCGWNVALKNIKGDVVLRVDAHTFFEKNFIYNNIKEIENGENIVGGKCVSVVKKENWKSNLLLLSEESIFGCGIADFRRKTRKQYVSTLAFAAYRKEVFDDVGYYNENLARTEDNEMHFRMKQKGYKFLLSPDITTYRYARDSFYGMIKQKYGNGKWIGITMYYCPKCFSVYHFIPLLFVLGILFSIVAAFLGVNIFLHLLFGAYTIFNIINVVLVSIKFKFKFYNLFLPFVLFILHVSYGFGTIVGLIGGVFKKQKNHSKE